MGRCLGIGAPAVILLAGSFQSLGAGPGRRTAVPLAGVLATDLGMPAERGVVGAEDRAVLMTLLLFHWWIRRHFLMSG